MPKPEKDVLDQYPLLIARLQESLPAESLVLDQDALAAFDSDALAGYHQKPMLVVLPGSTEEVAVTLKICRDLNIKIVPRGGGTSLSGGALPLADGIVLGLSRLNKVKDIDYANRCVVVEPGVTNQRITDVVAGNGFYYAPDPSSQIACTIGGNIAENSGGVHCLKYGLTTNNILGLELVTIDGDILQFGGKFMDDTGYDFLGLLTGSEGLLGIITEVTVRILKKPEVAKAMLVAFSCVEDGGRFVGDVIGAGIIPAGMEMMDSFALTAVDNYCQLGYPKDAGAMLIVELDGRRAEVDDLIQTVEAIANTNNATNIRISRDDQERETIWRGRKAAFPAVGSLSQDYLCMDGTIPRHTLPDVLNAMKEMSKKYGLDVANVFHAGDGNLHPLIMYNASIAGEQAKAEAFGADILKLCVEVGGVLTGEHGVGVEKRDLMETMFTDEDLKQQQRIKCAFDPNHRLNPGKVFPTLHRCAELGHMHVHKGSVKFPDLPRF
ncbi:FAD-linked oxidase C-terminal domain-containing protein [Kordiimonas sediminis]|nr:FAD-linked oxidase C-terminal domain-containing protein [Kordiimonas sediminis]